ncbi:hypothetical protein L9F63_009282, partial [Diploptera punctata]
CFTKEKQSSHGHFKTPKATQSVNNIEKTHDKHNRGAHSLQIYLNILDAIYCEKLEIFTLPLGVKSTIVGVRISYFSSCYSTTTRKLYRATFLHRALALLCIEWCVRSTKKRKCKKDWRENETLYGIAVFKKLTTTSQFKV